MTEVPPFLFIVTSTALVLGAAITIRGLLGFRPVTENAALPSPVTDDTLDAVTDVPGETTSTDAAPAGVTEPAGATDDPTPPDAPATPTYVVRDLREPIVMTMAGLLICMFTIVAIAALVHSA